MDSPLASVQSVTPHRINIPTATLLELLRSLYKTLMPKIPLSKPERIRGFDIGV